MPEPTTTNAWCCENTAADVPCELPADFLVIYGNAPDEITLMCQGHMEETWQPTWQTLPLTDEQRERYAVEWKKWSDSAQNIVPV